MRKIVVQAFEDPSRPQGGHAVILLRGLDSMPERPSIRLRPVEAGDATEARGLWRGARISPLATRATPLGIELVVGPDVVGHPHLLAGTPVVVEVPEADVRGEFLWPGVAPLAAPRRRHVVVPRQPRRVVAPPQPANDDATHLLTAPDHLTIDTISDGNLALTAEHPAPSVTAPQAQPAPASAESAAAEAPVRSAAADAATVASPIPDGAPPRNVLAASPTADAMRTAPAAPTMTTIELPSRGAAAPQWTPGRRKGLFASNGRIAAVAAGALLLMAAFWMMQGRRTPPADVAASGSGSPMSGGNSASGSSGSAKGSGPSGAGPSAAAVGPAAIATGKPAACEAPSVATEANPAGRMRLTIKAFCKAGEPVHVVYGGADAVHRLDDKGTLTTVIDCFAGAAEPVELRFADGSRQTVAVKAGDLDRVSKVAVIWKGAVDLDLHAFEYAALPGSKGDVWAGAAGSAEAVRQAVSADRRGHGFMSSSANARGTGDHIEVYTFVHADGQSAGSVGLALDHATRGEEPTDATCIGGSLAEVPYRLVVLPRGGAPRRENGIIAAAECGSHLGPEVRFNQSALPVLRIGK